MSDFIIIALTHEGFIREVFQVEATTFQDAHDAGKVRHPEENIYVQAVHEMAYFKMVKTIKLVEMK